MMMCGGEEGLHTAAQFLKTLQKTELSGQLQDQERGTHLWGLQTWWQAQKSLPLPGIKMRHYNWIASSLMTIRKGRI